MVTHRSSLDKPNSIQTRIVPSRLLDPHPKDEGRKSPLLLAFSRMLNLSCIRGHRDITRVTLAGADHDARRCLCNAREHCTLLYRVSSSRAKSSPPPPTETLHRVAILLYVPQQHFKPHRSPTRYLYRTNAYDSRNWQITFFWWLNYIGFHYQVWRQLGYGLKCFM